MRIKMANFFTDNKDLKFHLTSSADEKDRYS